MSKRINPTGRAIFLLMVLSFMLMQVSCIFDSPSAVPGYPSKVDFSIPFEFVGTLSMCECTCVQDLALIIAGDNIVLVDIACGDLISVFNTGVEIRDLGDTDVNGYGYVLTDSLLYPVDLVGECLDPPLNIGSGAKFISISVVDGTAWIVHENDCLTKVDLLTHEIFSIPSKLLDDCQGIAADQNGDVIFLAGGSRMVIAAFDTETWTETGSCSVPGDVISLFPGPPGYICALVEGSNELWYIKKENCELYKMITFPVVPTTAASMPDGSYAYATCENIGLIIVAESGQIEHRTLEFGHPQSIDINSDGQRAVICSAEYETVYILKK
ncbi:MAG: hypothetical protein KAW14_09305 [Candidatus Aegiribacteria sp.]|nr:hypothetical protein [Candidatus Aegiribacteria sp.]